MLCHIVLICLGNAKFRQKICECFEIRKSLRYTVDLRPYNETLAIFFHEYH